MGYRSDAAIRFIGKEGKTTQDIKDFLSLRLGERMFNSAEFTNLDNEYTLFWRDIQWYGDDVYNILDLLESLDDNDLVQEMPIEGAQSLVVGESYEDVEETTYGNIDRLEHYLTLARSIEL